MITLIDTTPSKNSLSSFPPIGSSVIRKDYWLFLCLSYIAHHDASFSLERLKFNNNMTPFYDRKVEDYPHHQLMSLCHPSFLSNNDSPLQKGCVHFLFFPSLIVDHEVASCRRRHTKSWRSENNHTILTPPTVTLSAKGNPLSLRNPRYWGSPSLVDCCHLNLHH